MWESWALPEQETGLWILWDESRLWRRPGSCWKGHKEWGDTLSIPAWILPAQGCLSFHFPPATSLRPGATWKTAGIGVSSKAPFPVSLQLGTGVQGCTNTPKCGGMVSGDLVTLGYCPQSTRIPRDCHVPVPTSQDPQPEEDPNGHREGRVAVLQQCQDDPEANVDNSIEDVDGLGKDEEEESLSRYCETHPTPIPRHSAGKGRGETPVPTSSPASQGQHPAGQSLWIPNLWRAMSHPQHPGMSPPEALCLQ